MEREGPGGDALYRAFISYSHRDAAFAGRLHRRLEEYALPRGVAGAPGSAGIISRRLNPIFRDRDELPAAKDLSAEVRKALAGSDTLVVICSPHAAASTWVGREIVTFRELHPDRPVLAALIAGEPGDAFPAALTADGAEPLAADFREKGDGPRLALLKLAAGISGARLDQLIQRDAQRRMARVTAVTVGALAAMLAMSVMTAVALTARAEAERQRTEAEGLVEFMLTDLREKLRGVGRLDVLTAVNARALAHYAGQDLDQLAPDALERRARILHAMGEDDMARGQTARALTLFQEARRTTAALMAAEPDNPERIFQQAQSEFWVAYVDYQAGRFAAARPGFTAYRDLAGRLAAMEPRSGRFQRELGFAEGNLCSLAIEGTPRDSTAALARCKAALDAMTAARLLKGGEGVLSDLANRQGWMADALQIAERFAEAEAQRKTQIALLDRLIAADPQNLDLKNQWIGAQRALARLEWNGGSAQTAIARLSRANALADALAQSDPANTQWKMLSQDVARELNEYKLTATRN